MEPTMLLLTGIIIGFALGLIVSFVSAKRPRRELNDLWTFVQHYPCDYSNGNVHNGVDEGTVVARKYLEKFWFDNIDILDEGEE